MTRVSLSAVCAVLVLVAGCGDSDIVNCVYDLGGVTVCENAREDLSASVCEGERGGTGVAVDIEANDSSCGGEGFGESCGLTCVDADGEDLCGPGLIHAASEEDCGTALDG